MPLDRRVWLECRTLVTAGFSVAVVCPRGEGDPRYEELEGVHLHKYTPPPVATGLFGYLREFVVCWLKTAFLALRVRRRHGFDVIQTCNPPDTYWALALPFKLLGVRFVFDQHDLCPEVYVSRFPESRRALVWGLRLLERATYRVADHVISTNESYRQVAVTRGRISPDRVSVVRSGPDPNRLFRGEAVPELRRGRTHLCCYLGVMGPQDRVDLVVRAADHIVHGLGRDDVHFALLGFGDCLDELRRLATDLGLGDRVTFTGRVDQDAIRAYLSTADVGLAPDPKSPLNDVSTHNKVMEYMACEVPVVSFDLKETRVSAGEAALYVERDGDAEAFADAVVALLDDPDRRARMGELGRRRVEEELAWAHQAPAYVEVFERLVS